jgi:YD repeat-containing protein
MTNSDKSITFFGSSLTICYPNDSENYSYDPLERLTEGTLENGTMITYTYDEAGNLTIGDGTWGPTSC